MNTEELILKDMKVANAVKCGKREEFYFNSAQYALKLYNSICVRIENKNTKESANTTLMNVISFNLLENHATPVVPATKKAGSKKSE